MFPLIPPCWIPWACFLPCWVPHPSPQSWLVPLTFSNDPFSQGEAADVPCGLSYIEATWCHPGSRCYIGNCFSSHILLFSKMAPIFRMASRGFCVGWLHDETPWERWLWEKVSRVEEETSKCMEPRVVGSCSRGAFQRREALAQCRTSVIWGDTLMWACVWPPRSFSSL